MSPAFIERLAEALRDEWVLIKRAEQAQGKHVPDDHLLPWAELDERNKEIDRRLAVAVIRSYVRSILPAIGQMIPDGIE